RILPPGDGLEALARLDEPQDLIFLDGRKEEYPRAFALALPKLRSGGLLVANSVLWGGAVARGETDPATAGLREYTRVAFGAGVGRAGHRLRAGAARRAARPRTCPTGSAQCNRAGGELRARGLRTASARRPDRRPLRGRARLPQRGPEARAQARRLLALLARR